ncbi:hypothetical protein ACG9X2_10710 [Acinetobacter bereziniae]|uniref:hypothetical protein n=1 Tax=Acinetobacter bereziniae TaxID=106648 RepID=UPI003AF9D290
MKIKIEEQEQTKIPSKLIDYKDGAKFMIAGIDKPSFKHCMELRGTRIEQEIQGVRDITDESSREIAQSFSKAVSHLVLNWQGLEDEEGNIFEYSKQNAELLCTSTNESIELIVWILAEAQKIQVEANEEKAETLGKSSSSTSTKQRNGTSKKQEKSIKS